MTDSIPIVSVILPTYDPSAKIREAVQSVIDQEVDLELIVVDDGSNMDVRGLLGSLGPQVRLLSESHRGVGAARAAGLAEARGQYVAFIDDDDAWLPGSLSRRMNVLAGRPDSEFLLSAPLAVNLAGIRAPWFEVSDLSPGSSRHLTRAEFCRIARERGYFFLQGFLGRLDSVRSCGGFDSALRASEDVDLFLRLLERGPALFLQEATFSRTSSGMTGFPSNRRGLVESQLQMLLKYEGQVRRAWGREDSKEFFAFRDSVLRQCVKFALLDRDLGAASRYARNLTLSELSWMLIGWFYRRR